MRSLIFFCILLFTNSKCKNFSFPKIESKIERECPCLIPPIGQSGKILYINTDTFLVKEGPYLELEISKAISKNIEGRLEGILGSKKEKANKKGEIHLVNQTQPDALVRGYTIARSQFCPKQIAFCSDQNLSGKAYSVKVEELTNEFAQQLELELRKEQERSNEPIHDPIPEQEKAKPVEQTKPTQTIKPNFNYIRNVLIENNLIHFDLPYKSPVPATLIAHFKPVEDQIIPEYYPTAFIKPLVNERINQVIIDLNTIDWQLLKERPLPDFVLVLSIAPKGGKEYFIDQIHIGLSEL